MSIAKALARAIAAFLTIGCDDCERERRRAARRAQAEAIAAQEAADNDVKGRWIFPSS